MTLRTRTPDGGHRSLVAVSHDPQRVEFLDALLVDTDDYDVIFVESIPHAYSRIRQVTPDLIVVLLDIGDASACQLLSMLRTDRLVSRIPVLTCVARPNTHEFNMLIADVDRDGASQDIAVQMN